MFGDLTARHDLILAVGHPRGSIRDDVNTRTGRDVQHREIRGREMIADRAVDIPATKIDHTKWISRREPADPLVSSVMHPQPGQITTWA
jgi:hypothetical protein